MKKKELLSMKKLTATSKMIELVRQDTLQRKTAVRTYSSNKSYDTYERYQYYRAIVENGILKVAIFSRKHLAAGRKTPEFEVYLSKSENAHLTYDVRGQKWRKGKIDSLPYDIDDGRYYGNKPWASDDTKQIVNEYLGTGRMEVREAVFSFQNQIGEERLRVKRKSEMDAIDAVMNLVPELPKDFEQWIMDSAYIHERYLMYRYGDKENMAYCTHCKQFVKLKDVPKHNTYGMCPGCKSKCLMKSWKKQKYLVDEKKVGIIQKLTDGKGYVLRRFSCKLKRTLEAGWELVEAGCWENERFQLDQRFQKVDFFEWGEFRSTGIIRWCHELNHGMNGYYYYASEQDECVLYPRNLKRLRKESVLKYMPLEEIWKRSPGSYCSVLRTLRNFINTPQLEYFIKAGLFRLTWDIAAGTSWSNVKCVDWDQNKPWKVLQITKEQMSICIKMDISKRQLEVLQAGNRAGLKLTTDQIRFFTREFGPDVSGDIFRYGHPEKFRCYLEELFKGNTKPGDYIDYLHDFAALHIVPDKDILFPKDFQQIHQRLAIQRQEREDELKKMEIIEKDKALKIMLPEVMELYHMENEEFVMVFPSCKEDFNREGRENHNCVGGTYFDKMLQGRCCVMFLRRKEEPDKAFCTVEMDGSRILQCRAVRNSNPPQEVNEFMEKFSKEVEKRIQKKQEKERIAIAI